MIHCRNMSHIERIFCIGNKPAPRGASTERVMMTCNDIVTTSAAPVNGLDSHYWDEPATLCNPFASEKLRRRSRVKSPHMCYELGPGYHGHPHGSIVVTDGDEWVVWERTAPEFLKNKT
jgi:hypothetical protein